LGVCLSSPCPNRFLTQGLRLYSRNVFSSHFSLCERSWQLAHKQIKSSTLCSFDSCHGMMCARSNGQLSPQTAHRCPASMRTALAISTGIAGLSAMPTLLNFVGGKANRGESYKLPAPKCVAYRRHESRLFACSHPSGNESVCHKHL